jgi:hypothetical protein
MTKLEARCGKNIRRFSSRVSVQPVGRGSRPKTRHSQGRKLSGHSSAHFGRSVMAQADNEQATDRQQLISVQNEVLFR